MFVPQPVALLGSGVQSTGAALYYERRLLDATAVVGGQARVAISKDDGRALVGVVGKRWFEGPGVMLMGELDLQRQWFDAGPTPLRYEISVTPNADAATFTGENTITIETSEPLTSVTMNALDLAVQRASIDNATARAELNAEAQTLTLTPLRPLAAGRHTIRIAYSGKIFDDAYGLAHPVPAGRRHASRHGGQASS